MPIPVSVLSNPLIFGPLLNALSRQHGPHYYMDPEFFRNMPKAVSVKGYEYRPIKFDYAGKSFNIEAGGSVRLTGKVMGQGSASTVFEGVQTAPSGKKQKVAVKLRDHTLLSLDDANHSAQQEALKLKSMERLGVGRAKYLGDVKIHGMQGIIMNQARGVSFRLANPQWINARTFGEIHAMFDIFDAHNIRPGDFQFNVDSKGKVYLVDVEGIDSGSTTRGEVVNELNKRRVKVGLKAIPPLKGPPGSMGPKAGVAWKGFFAESSFNMALGYAGYGSTKLLEHALDRKLSTTEQVGVYSGFFAPLLAYSGSKAFLAARGTGSGVLGSLGVAGKGLGKGLAGGMVTGIGAALLLNDLGFKGDAHTIGTIGIGSVAASHPAGIAFFAGYGFGKLLDWGTGKIFGKSLSDGLADKIEDTVEDVKWLYQTLNPYERRRLRYEQGREAWKERKFQGAVAKAKKFKALEDEARVTQQQVNKVENGNLKADAKRALAVLQTANKTLKDFPSLENVRRMLTDGGVSNYQVEMLDIDSSGRSTYLIKLRSGGNAWGKEKVNVTWIEGREPAMEVLQQGTANYSLYGH